MDADVIVIGAGLAGLTATRELRAAGLAVLTLEARDRIGGRVHTVADPRFPAPIELGAEFVHGRPPALLTELDRAEITRDDVSDEHWWFDGQRLIKSEDFEAELEPAFKRLAQKDQTFRADLASLPNTKELRKAKPKALMYVEGLDAADASRVGTRWLKQQADATEAIQAESLYRPTGSYAKLLAAFAPPDTDNIRLSHEVTGIAWQPGRADVFTLERATEHLPADRHFTARTALITLPLGVLQSNPSLFSPILPSAITGALAKLAPGPIIRALLAFDSLFWHKGFPTAGKLDPTTLNFIHSIGLSFPTIWTSRPHHLPLITCWAGGPAAQKLSPLSDSEIESLAIESLATMLGLRPTQIRKHLTASRIANWQSDPYAKGAYTYGLPGSITTAGSAAQSLQKPIGGTLFLAGEHTHEGLAGTTDAAISSGLRAAKQITRAFKLSATP